MNKIYTKELNTPIGNMVAGTSEQGICLLEFKERKSLQYELQELSFLLDAVVTDEEHPHLLILEQQLKEYFDGSRKEFELPIKTTGTDFQMKVWNKLLEIPYGKTFSYKQQAIKLNALLAIRAVASANGRNRISILIPCHRVIGENGHLTGYGGGLWRKKWLLDFEKKNSEGIGQAEFKFN